MWDSVYIGSLWRISASAHGVPEEIRAWLPATSWATCVWHCIARLYLTSDPVVVSCVHMADTAVWWDCYAIILYLFLVHSTNQTRRADGAEWGDGLRKFCVYTRECTCTEGTWVRLIRCGHIQCVSESGTEWLSPLISKAICCTPWQPSRNPTLYEVQLIIEIIATHAQAHVFVHAYRRCVSCLYTRERGRESVCLNVLSAI